MRIISGIYKGRKLTPPLDQSVRPTSERTREAMFNILMHGQFGGDAIIGQRIADICCGTGALGLEALSRGAAHATFVDSHPASIKLAEKNAAHLGASAACRFIGTKLEQLPKAAEPYALVFADPPYDTNLLAVLAEQLIAQGWLTTGGLLITEGHAHRDFPELAGYELLAERRYGKAKIAIWQR
jgi:16S rRNA (guanine966-N2)-methyltransferase